MADSRIKSASELLSAFFDKEIAQKGELYAGFGRAWKAIAGARLGEHTRPVDIRHGVLLVEAEHQGWIQLLQLRQDSILEEIQKKFAALEIRSLAFRLGAAGAPRPRDPSPRGPGPRAENEGIAAGEGAGPAAAAGPAAPAAAGEGSPSGRAEKAARRPGGASALPPDMAAAFGRIRDNIGKPGD